MQHERGEMQTAVVEDEAGFPIPCTSNAEEDYDETENFVEGAFSGDVQCALGIEEEENNDANFGKNGQTRRRLRHQGLGLLFFLIFNLTDLIATFFLHP